MTNKELELCKKKVYSVNPSAWKLSFHFLDRLKQKNIHVDLNILNDIFRHFDIIEYKIITKDRQKNERVVIRYNEFCLVLDLTSACIVTIWKNSLNDNHNTLKIEEYDKNLRVA